MLDAALAQSPTDPAALGLRGTILSASGDLMAAVAALEIAVRHHPKDYHLRHKLAQCLRRTGNDQRADEQMAVAEETRRLWRKFSELHSDAIEKSIDAELCYQLGEPACQLDRPDFARDWFSAALMIDPGMPQAVAALKNLDGDETPGP